MVIYFELEENPKGTAQMKGTAYQGGRIHHYGHCQRRRP